ncbi:hemerythrin domain-containing protein [Salsipaludibacter albus]|uniref:hemerythrin domain-containing protein n=1 Tax=Salsipaludibacter albus TaxID=2849650 RepID=UPI001EE48087|nr:hemerythrin domain-containing protein [Salsipaludibacter albus]
MPDRDVIDLILDDHRRFESLLRNLRSTETPDRAGVLAELAAVLVAHAEAEEAEVYPTLRTRDAIDEDEAEHGAEEHDEGHVALLDLMEVDDVDSDQFSEAVHELSEALSHHLDEEERTILNPAREEIDDEVLVRLGEAFTRVRQEELDDDCGDIANVRRLVARAEDRAE